MIPTALDHWSLEVVRQIASGGVLEIRSAFLDTGRRQSELAWLRADVQRIRDLAYRVNLKSYKGAYDLDMLLTRMEARTLLASVVEYMSIRFDRHAVALEALSVN